MDYHNLMKQRIANAWRDSKPVDSNAQPVQQDRMATVVPASLLISSLNNSVRLR